MINLNDKKSKETHWVSLFFDGNTTAYLDSFEIGYILQRVLNKTKVKQITHKIFRIQNNDSIINGHYCITFIKYMLAGYTKLFFSNKYKRNEKK